MSFPNFHNDDDELRWCVLPEVYDGMDPPEDDARQQLCWPEWCATRKDAEARARDLVHEHPAIRCARVLELVASCGRTVVFNSCDASNGSSAIGRQAEGLRVVVGDEERTPVTLTGERCETCQHWDAHEERTHPSDLPSAARLGICGVCDSVVSFDNGCDEHLPRPSTEAELVATIEDAAAAVPELGGSVDRVPKCRDCADALVRNSGICFATGKPCVDGLSAGRRGGPFDHITEANIRRASGATVDEHGLPAAPVQEGPALCTHGRQRGICPFCEDLS